MVAQVGVPSQPVSGGPYDGGIHPPPPLGLGQQYPRTPSPWEPVADQLNTVHQLSDLADNWWYQPVYGAHCSEGIILNQGKSQSA